MDERSRRRREREEGTPTWGLGINRYRDRDSERRNYGEEWDEHAGPRRHDQIDFERELESTGGYIPTGARGDYAEEPYAHIARPEWDDANVYDRAPRPKFRGRGPKGYMRSDEAIADDVNWKLTEAADVDATDVEVTVGNALVTLSGRVRTRFERQRAEELARNCLGVRDVENQVQVGRH